MNSINAEQQFDLFSGAVPPTPAKQHRGAIGNYWLPQVSEVIVDSTLAKIVLMASWTGEGWVGGYLVALWPNGLLEIMPGAHRRDVGMLYAPPAPIEAQHFDVLMSSIAREANITLASLIPWVKTPEEDTIKLTMELSKRATRLFS
jgi:hypothetical protein